jgi:amino acid transporter
VNSHKVSLQSAILMNLNIMAGAGIFTNIFIITKELQLFGGLLYFLVGCFMFPLIFTFAQLVQMYPTGGFYAFARPISPFLGFISCWSYFFGKLASVAFYLTVVTTFLQQLVPEPFEQIHPMLISLSILAFYVFLNCQNLRLGVIIQQCFAAAKTVPMILLIMLGIYHFDINILNSFPFTTPYTSFIFMLPSVLYCFSGFEAACSISRNIENAQVNAPKAIFYSFFTVILIYIAFQSLTSMMLMPNIGNISSYAQAYPYLMTLVPVNPWIQTKLATVISFLIGFSAMGAAYGVLFSNSWNLYTLAQNHHTFAHKSITTLNKHSIPYLAVIIEGFICGLFLWVTSGKQIPLQQISTLGGTITYTISTIALLYATTKSRCLGYLSLLTCSGFIVSCLISIYRYNINSLGLFASMFMLGMLMYWACREK